MKQRKCKACKTTFMPARTTQTACGIDCAMQLAHEKKVKLAERYGVSRSHVSGIQARTKWRDHSVSPWAGMGAR